MKTRTPGPLSRRSIRLRGYDYSSRGVYFVTICAWNRQSLFGEVKEGRMCPNSLGQVVVEEWHRTAELRPQVHLGAFTLLPNHLHGVLAFLDDGRRGVLQYAPTPDPPCLRSPSLTLGAIVRGFKGAATKRINSLRSAPGQPVWQRNYFERVVRDGRELAAIERYIWENAFRWEFDRENPALHQRIERDPNPWEQI